MKIVVIVLVTVLAAARAHAQAGTGMLAPWNANAHPIGASSGAEMRMPRSSSPRTSSPSFEAPHTSVVPPSTWSPAPVPLPPVGQHYHLVANVVLGHQVLRHPPARCKDRRHRSTLPRFVVTAAPRPVRG